MVLYFAQQVAQFSYFFANAENHTNLSSSCLPASSHTCSSQTLLVMIIIIIYIYTGKTWSACTEAATSQGPVKIRRLK